MERDVVITGATNQVTRYRTCSNDWNSRDICDEAIQLVLRLYMVDMVDMAGSYIVATTQQFFGKFIFAHNVADFYLEIQRRYKFIVLKHGA